MIFENINVGDLLYGIDDNIWLVIKATNINNLILIQNIVSKEIRTYSKFTNFKTDVKIQRRKNMILEEVKSSSIKAIGYNGITSVLYIVLKNAPNFVYEYKNVPFLTYYNLKEHSSKGSFFVKEIKDKFEYSKNKL